MVVVVGFTDREPDAETEPMPWSIVTVVAFVVVHDRVDDEPETMVLGVAVNVTVGGVGGGLTNTVAVAVVDPALFVAVSV